ncbi:glycoside hydrolase family 2 protein [Mangrovibacterium lignilyticum]|uniref:glycoside hydrolase family 2 protein n=1 Tax=Mangrovibacterium lignilyticum TaxID=2668052 RepID=UPI0013D693A1|nr:glycoside hydrolase family 2 TIM barrel-domain containing protein [Mangrovibacterium lignilyticum]
MNRFTLKLAGILCLLAVIVIPPKVSATVVELNKNWKSASIAKVKASGEQISVSGFNLKKWKPAIVPGTVLTNMLEWGEVPDPFYGMNNNEIKDIYETGRDHYTYWFANDFQQKAQKGEQVWLHFRGVNYSCDIYLNGKKVNAERHYGMYLRQTYNVTKLLAADGNNRLAVIVYPVDPVGNPNGGQGGDGTIAKSVSLQYVAGWDWIQPIRDRNTGIWDKVTVETTKAVNLQNPHVITRVPGVRTPGATQAPANIETSTELVNASSLAVTGKVVVEIAGQKVEKEVSLAANSTSEIQLPNIEVSNPRLWWPNGYGEHNLYTMSMKVYLDGQLSDEEEIEVGIREIQHRWNDHTRSMQISVNGQKIFIKGGNWIISDAMLRFTPERYDAEIRYHRDMNLNLIRIWGGALPERPEFYDACNKYGMLVIQDFWMSGDCNGRWVDPMKKEDQWTRRKYPDDHNLFVESAADVVKMIRNNPSLAIWCGGNEIAPPQDILAALKDSLDELDGTRWFIEYSNSDSMSYNFIGGNGDGPYGIQPDSIFWQHRTWPFNSEVGSVGVGDATSLKRFLPKENQVVPVEKANSEAVTDDVWTYHKYIGYGNSMEPYGGAENMEQFAKTAQLVNYNQYRALMEGFSSHMWDWYTGTIIWKTQNPWTALRGQMYDYYLDPNACLFGTRVGSQPIHAMCNPVDKMVTVVNNSFGQVNDLMLVIKAYDMAGKEYPITQVFVYSGPTSVKKIMSVDSALKKAGVEKDGVFLQLQLLDHNQKLISDNFYWYPNAEGKYSGLQELAASQLKVVATKAGDHKVKVVLKNPEGAPVAFFNHLAIVDAKTKERVLPVFADDNYVSVVPGSEKTIIIDCPQAESSNWELSVDGYNLEQGYFNIK